MAEKGSDGGATTQPAGGLTKMAAGASETITKKEAVRRSLAKLGKNAQPVEIQKDIKERFGIDMTTGHISTTKGELRRGAKGKKKGGTKQAASKPETAPVQPARPAPTAAQVTAGKAPAIPLEDILVVRALVDRLGAAPLKTLIDALGQ